MITVTVYEDNRRLMYEAKPDERLIDFLGRNGYTLTAPCGGCNRCGGCRVKASGNLSEISREEMKLLTPGAAQNEMRLACFAGIEGDCEIHIDTDSGSAIQTAFESDIKISGAKKSGCGFAVDIGTTTVAVYLYSLESGKRLGVRAAANAQRSFGSDVITRIEKAAAPGGLTKLSSAITEQLSEMMSALCAEATIDRDMVKGCVIAGNTTMLHLLCGLDPLGLAVSPFEGESLFGTEYHSRQLGLPFDAPVYLSPCVSAYVGGDITAGMNAVRLCDEKGATLYLDLGTNGEIALFDGCEIICCSAAAGPVFEGAHISCGMPGTDGAIKSVRRTDGKLVFETVGQKPPRGLCGSGIIDAVSVMLEDGIIDETGYLEDDFTIDALSHTVITPADVRQIQLAKSAIYSGTERLCAEAGISQQDIEKVILAGGFGSNVNPRSACNIGLIDKALAEKCECVGNAAGMGAAMALINPEYRLRLEAMPDKCRYLELSSDKLFNRLYVDNMMFLI